MTYVVATRGSGQSAVARSLPESSAKNTSILGSCLKIKNDWVFLFVTIHDKRKLWLKPLQKKQLEIYYTIVVYLNQSWRYWNDVILAAPNLFWNNIWKIHTWHLVFLHTITEFLVGVQKKQCLYVNTLMVAISTQSYHYLQSQIIVLNKVVLQS